MNSEDVSNPGNDSMNKNQIGHGNEKIYYYLFKLYILFFPQVIYFLDL